MDKASKSMHLLGTPDPEEDIKNQTSGSSKKPTTIKKNFLKICEKNERILNDSMLNVSILSFWKSC